MRIDNLPDDLLVIIFDLLVFNRLQYRKSLFLTSKRWYTVAKNYAPLWAKIAFRWEVDEYSNRIMCSDLESLSQVIRMAGKAPLDLYFSATDSNKCTDDNINKFLGSVPENWTSSCRFLHLRSSSVLPQDVGEVDRIAKLFGSACFEQLEKLELFKKPRDEVDQSLAQHILESVVVTSPNLRILRTNHAAEVFRHPSLLHRLSELHIGDDSKPNAIPWKHLSNLERLTFSNLANPDEEVLSKLIRFNLLELRMDQLLFAPTTRFLNLLGARLTHLTVTNFSTQFDETLYFPDLQCFSVFTSARFRYDLIAAPKLSELILWYPYYETNVEYIESITLSPRRVVVNINRSSMKIYKGFFKATKLWTMVDELHIRMDLSDPANTCLKAIVDNLKDQSDALRYLKLRLLSVLYDGSVRAKNDLGLPRNDGKAEFLLREAVTELAHVERSMIGVYSNPPHGNWRSQWVKKALEDPRVDWTACVRLV